MKLPTLPCVMLYACCAVLAGDCCADQGRLSSLVQRIPGSSLDERIRLLRDVRDLDGDLGPVLEDLVALFADDYLAVRESAVALVATEGSNAVSHIRGALQSDSYHSRTSALLCLHRIGPEAADAAPDVIALALENGDISTLAVNVLCTINPGALLTLFEKVPLGSSLWTKNIVSRSIESCIRAKGPAAKAVLQPQAHALLKSPHRFDVLLGVEVLQRCDAGDYYESELGKLLNRNMAGNWRWICDHVKAQGKQGSWAIPALIDIVNKSDDGWAIATACTVLEEIGAPEALVAVPHLLHALERPEGHVKRYVARALFMLRADPDSVLPALRHERDTVSCGTAKAWLSEAITGLEAIAAGQEPPSWSLCR